MLWGTEEASQPAAAEERKIPGGLQGAPWPLDCVLEGACGQVRCATLSSLAAAGRAVGSGGGRVGARALHLPRWGRRRDRGGRASTHPTCTAGQLLTLSPELDYT